MLINLRKRSLKSDERQPSPRCSQAARARLWPLLHHSQGLTAPPQATISAISQAFGAISQARICPCLLLIELEASKKVGCRIFRKVALLFAKSAARALSGTPSTVLLQNLFLFYKKATRAAQTAAVAGVRGRGLRRSSEAPRHRARPGRGRGDSGARRDRRRVTLRLGNCV